ncbi:MAG TPA: hypothetical protein DIS66_02175, partial [Candidatus Omnitrophica bacterium]|nr:hypothetical protein [Candidatus Omnitrophota bacterium]
AFWLEYQSPHWNLVYPARALADQSLAQGMAGMVKMAMSQKLVRPEADWEEYGLKDPDMKIGVGTSSGPDRHFLYLGKNAPLGDVVFARWDDKQAYFTLPSAVKDAFRKTAYEMREKRVFLTPLPKMDKITVALGERSFEWVLKNGAWYWMEPLDLLGKPMAEDQMTAVIQILSRLYAKEFIAESDQAKLGSKVDMIGDRILIRSGSQNETVFIGDEEPLKTAYYARRENDKNLFLIDQTKVIEILDLVDALDKLNHPDPIKALKNAEAQVAAQDADKPADADAAAPAA